MLLRHKSSGADCTIAAIKVPLSEASRFGILNVDDDGVIYEFEEKPKKPKSDLASMGIYIFSAQKLYKYLEEDEADEKSSNDFGKNVLPRMLNAGEKMVAYTFNGYWRDVGTINSLYESNMDLLGGEPEFDISDPSWRIRSRNPIAPPQYLGDESRVVNSIIVSGCDIEGTVENSILSHDVTIGKGAVVRNSVIYAGVTIDENSTVDHAIIDENVRVGKGVKVGAKQASDDKKITVLGRDIAVSDNKTIEIGAIIDENV